MSQSTSQQIIQYFILNAPAAEIDQVINDLKILTNNHHVLSDQQLSSTLHTYNTNHLVHFSDSSNSDKLLITPYNQLSTQPHSHNQSNYTTPAHDQFFDPNTRKIYNVNHITRSCTASVNLYDPIDSVVESTRTALQQQLDTYINDFYTSNKVLATVYVSHSELIVCISGKNANLGNYWSGSWNSIYKYNTTNQQLSGIINIQVHYFEDGNIQSHNTHKLDAIQLEHSSDNDTVSKSIMKQIELFESRYHESLNDVYENMNDNTFKQMRRYLPISRVKFAWSNYANNHSLFEVMSKANTNE